MTARKFKYQVPIMLVSAVTAARNMETHIAAFANDYPTWTAERLLKYYVDIEEISQIIGLNSAKAQHEATALIKQICEKAIEDAKTIRNQMKRGYRKETVRLESLLQLFGFSKSWEKASRGAQYALLALLHTFNSNLDETLQNELITHEVSERRIESMKNAAHELMQANITQETLKSEAPVMTSEMTIRLNEIYDTAIDICNAGKTVFSKDPVRKALFSFTKLAAQQMSSGKPKTSAGDGKDAG